MHAGNTAKFVGGGIYLEDSNFTASPGSSTLIEGNNSTQYGGGIFCSFSSAIVLAGAVIMRGNVAGHTGGGVLLQGLSEDYPTRLFTASGGTLTVEGNRAQHGGGLATTEFVVVDLVGAAFLGNAAEQSGYALAMKTRGSTIVLDEGALARNVAAWGGGAFVFGATLSLRGTAILDNSALLAGGAVAAYSAATVSLAASRLANNSAVPPGVDDARCKGRCGGWRTRPAASGGASQRRGKRRWTWAAVCGWSSTRPAAGAAGSSPAAALRCWVR